MNNSRRSSLGFVRPLANMRIRNQILLGFALPILLMLLVTLSVYLATKDLIESGKWVEHTHEVIAEARLLEKLIVDMETGERGFLITGKENFLEPFNSARQSWQSAIDRIKQLTSDNLGQGVRADEIDALAHEWLRLAAEPEIALRRQVRLSTETETETETMLDVMVLVERETGKNIIDSIRAKLQEFIAVEEALIEVRTVKADLAAEITLFKAVAGAGVAIFIALLCAFVVIKAIFSPLMRLLSATKSVASGDFSQEIQVRENNEIGDLSDSFNLMIEALRKSTALAEKSQQGLEQQAAMLVQRNTAIEQTNKDLLLAHEKLAEQAEDLAKSSEYKSEFIASMSHEIRTPMNGVLGMLGLLLKSTLTREQKHRARMAHASAESLLDIINDILDFSKIEAGKLEIERVDFDLHDLFADFSEIMAFKAQEKGIEFVLDVTEIDVKPVCADPTRLRQILTNLVSNAIKFTHAGEIVVRAALVTGDEADYRLECSVSDTGIGIAKQKQRKLFEAFTQVDASTTRQYGGTGLGLSIVKQLCQLMGGDIEVSSSETGSIFSFTIALDRAVSEKPILTDLSDASLSILLVGNNASLEKVFSKQLNKWGVEVQAAARSTLAMEMIEADVATGQPSIRAVFVDSNLQKDDELNLIKWLGEKHSRIASVLMTPIEHGYGEAQLEALGCDIHLTKPVTPSDLFDSLSTLSATDGAVDGLHHTVATDDLYDFAANWPADTRILLVEDNLINQEVARGILEDLGLAADIASSGVEAIDMLSLASVEQPYTAILMDCQMPEMDGYQATQEIRAGAAGQSYQDSLIIALTANAMTGDKEKCLAAGMTDYLTKPIEPEMLNSLLAKWLIG